MRDLIWIQKILKGERWNSKIREEAKEVWKERVKWKLFNEGRRIGKN